MGEIYPNPDIEEFDNIKDINSFAGFRQYLINKRNESLSRSA